MSHKPGGGLHSKVVTHSTNPKVEPKAYARNPGAVAQYGALVGSHVTRGRDSDYRGDPDPLTRRGYNNPVGPTNMALSGPGAGREVLRSGGQSGSGGYGPSNLGSAPAKNKDILGAYGPESRSRSGNPNRRFSDVDADES